ncbi:MAG: hypothetical protein KDC54_22630 [Lewinella sp.]|nr:hypothetical protein [Lewinella sp.]
MDGVDLETVLRPETELERTLLRQESFRRGLRWGVPRYGHPEGEVFKHVREVLDNIDQLRIHARDRERLRIVAFVHDAFKYQEDKSHPRDWSRHHGVLARQFLEPFHDDPATLLLTEWHDEAYYVWRDKHLFHLPEEAEGRWAQLLELVDGHNQLYYLFFKCDTLTGDKNLAPVDWFESHFPKIELVSW